MALFLTSARFTPVESTKNSRFEKRSPATALGSGNRLIERLSDGIDITLSKKRTHLASLLLRHDGVCDGVRLIEPMKITVGA